MYLFSKFILLSPPLYRIPKNFTIGPKSGNTGLPQTQGNQGNQGNHGKPSHILKNSGNFNFSQGNQGKNFTPSKKNILKSEVIILTEYVKYIMIHSFL